MRSARLVERLRRQPPREWPDALLLPGGEVYLDQVSPETERLIEERCGSGEARAEDPPRARSPTSRSTPDLLEEATAVLGPSPARLEHARVLVESGALLRRCGQRTAAAERLRARMDLAHPCQATTLVETAAAELRLAGARPQANRGQRP